MADFSEVAGAQGRPDDFRIWLATNEPVSLYAPQIFRDTADKFIGIVKTTPESTDRSELITAAFMCTDVWFDRQSTEGLLDRYRVLRIGELLVAQDNKIPFNISAPPICRDFMDAATRSAKADGCRTSRSELLTAAFMVSCLEVDGELTDGQSGKSMLRRYRSLKVSDIRHN